MQERDARQELDARKENSSRGGPPLPGRPVRGSATGRPLMAAMDLLGRRWSLRIIWELRDGPLGARALLQRCDRMSSSVLYQRLDELTAAQLLTRDEAGAYTLTTLGTELGPALGALDSWAARWSVALADGAGERAAVAVADRIAAGDKPIRAFMPEPGRAERLVLQAREAARRWPDAEDRPPLFGIATGVKDIIRVDGLPTTGGSQVPPEALAGPEASVVHRLREAGALIAGKTVTAEFAMFAPGPTRNPRDPRHTPGGSSSGSAAAVAAGLVPLALGTQTIASVIRPAAYCGVAGFRPTHGRIPVDGVLPNAPTLDVVGCFSADVAGLAAAVAVLCDGWKAHTGDSVPVLGIPAGPYLERASQDALAAFSAQARSLAAAGFPVREVAVLDDFAAVERLMFVINRFEAAAAHAAWFARYGSLYRPETAALIRAGQAIGRDEHAAALAGRAEAISRLADVADHAGVDLWITPAATGPAPASLATTGDPVMSMPWSLAGLPAVSIPAGQIGGLPVGLQCVGAAGADEQLLSWAAAIAAALDQGD